MKLYKTRWFNKWARKSHITDQELAFCVSEAEQGLIDANLGGYLLKQRLAKSGRGKSSGQRLIIATKKKDTFFSSLAFLKIKKLIFLLLSLKH